MYSITYVTIRVIIMHINLVYPANQWQNFGKKANKMFVNDHFMLCKLKLAPLLTQLFNIIITTNDTPETFTQAHITLIYKHGNPADPKSWRPINLCNSNYKFLTGICNQRLKEWQDTQPVFTLLSNANTDYWSSIHPPSGRK